MSIAIAIILLVSSIISLYHLDWALMLVLAGLPLYLVRFSVFGIPSTLLELMILIVFFVWISKNYKQTFKNIKSKIKRNKSIKSNRYPFDLELILVLIISFIAMGVSGFSNPAMGIWKAYFFEPIIVYLLIFNVFFKKEKEESFNLNKIFFKIIFPLSISAFFISSFAIYQKISGNFIPNELWAASETRRVTSFFAYPNAVGLFLGPIFMLMFAYLLSVYNKYKKQSCRVECIRWSPFDVHWFKTMPLKEKITFSFIKLSSVLSILAIYFARSEGAIIAIALAVALMLFFSRSFRSFGVNRLLIISSTIFLLIFISVYSPLREYTINKISLNDFSGQIRKAQWQDTAIMLRDGHYLFGAGLAGFQKVIEPYHSAGVYIKNNDLDFERLIKVSPEYQAKHWQPLEIFLYPHNIFLNFWVELGLLGMLIFIWIILKVFYLNLKILFSEKLKTEDRYLLLGTMSAMFVLVIHGIVDVPYFKNDLAVIFWVIVALMGVIQLKNKNYEL